MLNPIQNAEAIHSATYVDNYIDSVENLPDDVQRHLSRIRDIDVQYRSKCLTVHEVHEMYRSLNQQVFNARLETKQPVFIAFLRDVDHYYDLWKSLPVTESLTVRRRALMLRMHQCLIKAQELGDDKMHIVTQLQDLIDCKTRQLDMDQKNLDIKGDEQHDMVLQAANEYGTPAPPKQSRSQSPGVTEPSSLVAINGGGTTAGSGSGGSTPNSERSGHTSNGPGASCGIHTTNSNLCVSESQRSANKRSRRRNENIGSNSCITELACNESNSANEAGSIGGSGPDKSITKSSNIGNIQKRSSSQSQSGGIGTINIQSITASSMIVGGVSASTSASAGNNTSKKKKRKARGGQTSSAQISTREETPPPDPIDPDEPTYCICNQISFGEMILCDNDLCPIEWFHFSCVSLVFKPKGRWYCPNCRGDRPNIMKPKAQFLKELERYNKEKEERT